MYFRSRNTTRRGGSFDAATVIAVWQKANPVFGYDARYIRKDGCGAWIRYADYGTTGEYGWEIDHHQPVAAGGGDEVSNLQPLHWQNNRHKGDNYPNWRTVLDKAALRQEKTAYPER